MAVALAMSIYHLYVAFFGAPDAQIFRATHVLFALVIAFLAYPMLTKGRVERPGILEFILVAASIAACGYQFFAKDVIDARMIYVDDLTQAQWVLGLIFIFVVLEATRRVLGLVMPLTALIFIIYALFIHGTKPQELVEQLFLTTDGILGIPVSVSATYVMLFILFGSFVERSGAGKLFMDFALGLTGGTAGGPAKVAVLTSALFGSVSGSAVANVMTTGTFSIPLMKRIGYRPAFAGAVEAVASTGGQIMPPIMGAAAFVMAEFLGVAYATVAMYALIPALLYFLAVFFAVHFEAKRLGMEGLPRSELPSTRKVLFEEGHLFIPLVVIIGMLVAGFSAPLSALCGIFSVIPTMLLRPVSRKLLTVNMILESLVDGARNTVQVALACACAGIVIGIIALTGLGIEFTALVLKVAQNQLLVALILTMVAGIVLGMGMPTTPAYIMQVALLVPAIVKLGISQEAAHMFVFYFAILSAITPPVALAVYAANTLSGAGIWESSWAAVKLGLTGYIVPFMFVFGPSLLMVGEPTVIATTAATAIIGVILLAGGLHGYLLSYASWWQRLLMIAAAFCLIKPGFETDIAGAVITTVVVIAQLVALKRAKPARA
ncbi:MAG: TRAP transporter permease [Hyphomicrobiaceae bacterium]|nr:TRAP transporter permease [Hyphomicrobiaceae bacterium]